MNRPLSKTLLKARHWPHYVQDKSRAPVLYTYKQLVKEINSFIDPLCRQYLRASVYETFLAYKYVTNPNQIKALLAQANLTILKLKSANRGNPDATNEMLIQVMRSIYIDEFPSYKLHQHPRVERDSLLFRIKHLCVPHIQSYDDEKEKLKTSSDLFYRFGRLLLNKHITSAEHGRKIKYDLPVRLTVFGKIASPLRINNLVAKHYKLFLDDAPTPVHPQVLEYVEQQLMHPKGVKRHRNRFYRRRLQNLQRYLFTIEENEGELKMVFPKKAKSSATDIYFTRPG